jgi:hypothetical protein
MVHRISISLLLPQAIVGCATIDIVVASQLHVIPAQAVI